MRLPEMTHLQFLIVNFLFDGRMSGRELRHELRRWETPRSRPSFYALMQRMEVANYVEGSYRGHFVPGGKIRERIYQVTDFGRVMWEMAATFYQGFDPPPLELETAATDLVRYAGLDPKQRKARLVREVKKEVGELFDRARRR